MYSVGLRFTFKLHVEVHVGLYLHLCIWLSFPFYEELKIVIQLFLYLLFMLLVVGQLTRQVYESMRREASCLRIQRVLRMYIARKAYRDICASALAIQIGMRGMAARNELRFRRQTQAAIIIQVNHFFGLGQIVELVLRTSGLSSLL